MSDREQVIQEAQKDCACKLSDALECYRSRYPIDDSEYDEGDDDKCECPCHAEIEAYDQDLEDSRL